MHRYGLNTLIWIGTSHGFEAPIQQPFQISMFRNFSAFDYEAFAHAGDAWGQNFNSDTRCAEPNWEKPFPVISGLSKRKDGVLWCACNMSACFVYTIHTNPYLYTYVCIHPSIDPSIYPSIHESIHPWIHLSIYLSLKWMNDNEWCHLRPCFCWVVWEGYLWVLIRIDKEWLESGYCFPSLPLYRCTCGLQATVGLETPVNLWFVYLCFQCTQFRSATFRPSLKTTVLWWWQVLLHPRQTNRATGR